MAFTSVVPAFLAESVYNVSTLSFTKIYENNFDNKTKENIYEDWSAVFGQYATPVQNGRLSSLWSPPNGIGYAFKKSYMNVKYDFNVALLHAPSSLQDVIVLRNGDVGNAGNFYGDFDKEKCTSGIGLYLYQSKYPGKVVITVAGKDKKILNDAVVCSLPYPAGIDFLSNTDIAIYDLDDTILYFINNKPFAAIKLSELKDNFYNSGKVYNAGGKEVGEFKCDVARISNFAIVNRVSTISIDNFSISSLNGAKTKIEKEKYIVPDLSKIRDNYSDTWVAADDEGRTMPTSDKVGGPKKDKIVGMFYFVNKSGTNNAYNNTYETYLKAGGGETGVSAIWDMIRGKKSLLFWGEPYFGYYTSDDEWVIRKHATMMVNAGVNFIFYDCSNNSLHAEGTKTIFKVYKQMREEGLQTPQIAYFLGDQSTFANNLIPVLYEDVYETGQYSDLWFMWEGKPLIFANVSGIKNQEILDTFTIRRSWAFENGEPYKSTQGKGTWLWADVYPQAPGYSPEGKLEQMIVMSGFWANGNGGRSNISTNPTSKTNKFSSSRPKVDDFEFSLVDDGTSGKGLAYQEHWDYAKEIDPPIVMITGWNEWNVTNSFGQGNGQVIANTFTVNVNDPLYNYCFVDSFNPEFSRDIEPMKGGYGDNYYYQTVQNIRSYKGARPVPVNVSSAGVSGLSGWEKVSPYYYDTLHDTTHRDKAKYAGEGNYVNKSGRNDFDYSKVSVSDGSAAFYAKTRDNIVTDSGQNWMNLFIDIDQNAKTGWKGYDYIINRSRKENTVSVEKCVGNAWKWETAGEASYQLKDNEIVITIPSSVINFTSDFDFKWADNSTTTGDIMEFMDLGDTAPDDRFNYRVKLSGKELSADVANILSNGNISMQINNPFAFKGLSKIQIDAGNLDVTPLISNNRTLVPARFISENFEAKVDWNQATQTVTINYGEKIIKLIIGKATIEINGAVKDIDTYPQIINSRTFVPLRAIVEALDKKVYWDPRGLILIGDDKVLSTNETISTKILDALK